MTATRFAALPTADEIKLLVNAATTALKVEEAMFWEGDGLRRSFLKDSPDRLNAAGELETCRRFGALSVVEHSGDEDGIRDGIAALKGTKATVEAAGRSYEVSMAEIMDSDLTRGDERGDDDYEVRATATLRFVFTQQA